MTRKNAIFASGLLGLPLVIAFAGLMSAHSLCACTSVEENLVYLVGASPIRDPDEFRVRLMAKLPRGSTTDEMYLVLGSLARGHQAVEPGEHNLRYEILEHMKQRCVTNTGELSCRFVLAKRWWGYNEIGFYLNGALDGVNRLKDVRVSPYSVWGAGKA